jgi:hypothetical protein
MPHLFRDTGLTTCRCEEGSIAGETGYSPLKTKRTGPGKPGPMRFQHGLLPYQFIVRRWLPVFCVAGLTASGKEFLF